MDEQGRLKKVNGHCIRFNPLTRKCRDYDKRPAVCRNFPPGCGRCVLMRLSLDRQMNWLTKAPGPIHVPKGSYMRGLKRVHRTRDSNGNLISLEMDDPTSGEIEALERARAHLPSNGH
jgi:hypothetical protein